MCEKTKRIPVGDIW